MRSSFPQSLRAARRREPAQGQPHTHENFETKVLEIPIGANLEELEGQLAGLDALRIKGFVETSQGLRLVQGVGARIELSEVDARPSPKLVGRLVVIRRGA